MPSRQREGLQPFIGLGTSEDVSSVLNHFVSRGTNAYTEVAHTQIKLMKRASYGFRNVSVYIKKMLLIFLPPLLLTLYRGGPHVSS